MYRVYHIEMDKEIGPDRIDNFMDISVQKLHEIMTC